MVLTSTDMALVIMISLFVLGYTLNNIIHSWRQVQLAKYDFEDDGESTTSVGKKDDQE